MKFTDLYSEFLEIGGMVGRAVAGSKWEQLPGRWERRDHPWVKAFIRSGQSTQTAGLREFQWHV